MTFDPSRLRVATITVVPQGNHGARQLGTFEGSSAGKPSETLGLTARASRGWAFTVKGPPRTKKTSQRIARRRDGTPFIMSAKTSIGWEQSAILQLRAQMHRLATHPSSRNANFGDPVNCRALIYRDRAAGDAVNFYQAIADALEGAGVVQNDRLIVSWDGSRLLKDAVNPRVEIVLTPATL